MAGKAGDEAVESAIDDGSAAEWALERAAELDLEPHEFLERIMHAYRLAERSDEAATEPVDDDAMASLRADLDALEADLDELIEDVRDRVIQVKRETDAKAAADHDHEALESRLETLQGDLDAVSERVEDLEGQIDGGFENFEEILSHLVDRTDDVADDVATLGGALVTLKETLETVTAREQARARADRLKKTAAQRGVRTAKCDDCGSKIDLALLTDASCPTCDATFQDLDPDPGFFGRSVLETGSRPALEAPSDVPSADEIESVASGSGRARVPDREDWFVGAESKPEAEDADE